MKMSLSFCFSFLLFYQTVFCETETLSVPLKLENFRAALVEAANTKNLAAIHEILPKNEAEEWISDIEDGDFDKVHTQLLFDESSIQSEGLEVWVKGKFIFTSLTDPSELLQETDCLFKFEHQAESLIMVFSDSLKNIQMNEAGRIYRRIEELHSQGDQEQIKLILKEKKASPEEIEALVLHSRMKPDSALKAKGVESRPDGAKMIFEIDTIQLIVLLPWEE